MEETTVENPILQLLKKKKMVIKQKFNSLFINEPNSEQIKTKEKSRKIKSPQKKVKKQKKAKEVKSLLRRSARLYPQYDLVLEEKSLVVLDKKKVD